MFPLANCYFLYSHDSLLRVWNMALAYCNFFLHPYDGVSCPPNLVRFDVDYHELREIPRKFNYIICQTINNQTRALFISVHPTIIFLNAYLYSIGINVHATGIIFLISGT